MTADVVVLGSLNADLVAVCDRLPAPGETVLGHRHLVAAGGKGSNQAVAAARAGASVAMIGAVGDDTFAPTLRAALGAAGVDTAAVRTVPGPSGTAHVRVDGAGDNSIVVVPGANGALTSLLPSDRDLVAGAAVLLLQLESPLDAVVEAAQHAAAEGVTVVLTPAPARSLPDALLDAVHWLVPNQHEATVVAGTDDPERAATLLADRGIEVVVTLGADGCLHVPPGGPPRRVPGHPVPAVDTTGAGDAFTGVLAASLAAGRSTDDALERATVAAGLSVTSEGATTGMPGPSEIERALADRRR